MNLIKTFFYGINRYLSMDEEFLQKLARYEGKSIKISLRELNKDIFLKIGYKGFEVMDDSNDSTSVTIRGPLWVLIKLMLNEGQKELLDLQRNLEIQGDLTLAQGLQKLLKSHYIDWEEKLSYLLGDLVAHQASHTFGQLTNWIQNAKNAFIENIAEYIHEEIKLSPPKEELDDFQIDINALRDDVDRIEARLELLMRIII